MDSSGHEGYRVYLERKSCSEVRQILRMSTSLKILRMFVVLTVMHLTTMLIPGNDPKWDHLGQVKVLSITLCGFIVTADD